MGNSRLVSLKINDNFTKSSKFDFSSLKFLVHQLIHQILFGLPFNIDVLSPIIRAMKLLQPIFIALIHTQNYLTKGCMHATFFGTVNSLNTGPLGGTEKRTVLRKHGIERGTFWDTKNFKNRHQIFIRNKGMKDIKVYLQAILRK